RVALATVDSLERYHRGNEIRTKRLDALVRAVADASDAHVTLFTVPRSRTRPPKMPTTLSDSAAAKDVQQTTALSDLAAKTTRIELGYGALQGKAVTQAAIPILDKKKRTDWVVLYSRTLDGVTETVDLIRRKLFAAAVVAGLIAIVAAYLVAGFVGRRVRRLERASRRVAAGQSVAPLPVTARD